MLASTVKRKVPPASFLAKQRALLELFTTHGLPLASKLQMESGRRYKEVSCTKSRSNSVGLDSLM